MITTDKINHPSHYTAHPSGVECIEITEGFSFNIGNAIKYLWRADEKGAPLDDLRKAGWYIEREITRRTDAEKTIDLVTKSASSADARRQYEMGNMAYSGDGMPQDREQAIEWWTLSARQGNAEAQRALDACTPPPSTPIPVAEIDARLADIRRLAAGGDRSAQQYLSECYRHGWYGLPISPELASMWHNRANEPRTEEEAHKALDGDALGIDAYNFLVAKSASSPTQTQ
jgi:TPR repeat protein